MTFRFRLASRVLLSVFCLFVSERSNLTASHRSSDKFQLSPLPRCGRECRSTSHEALRSVTPSSARRPRGGSRSGTMARRAPARGSAGIGAAAHRRNAADCGRRCGGIGPVPGGAWPGACHTAVDATPTLMAAMPGARTIPSPAACGSTIARRICSIEVGLALHSLVESRSRGAERRSRDTRFEPRCHTSA